MVSNLSPDHLRAWSELHRLLHSLSCICSHIAWHRYSVALCTSLATARLVAIGKADGGLATCYRGNPSTVGWEMLIARYQADDVSSTLIALQVGVGVMGGDKSVIHRARAWFDNASIKEGLLELDFPNTFNCLGRGHV